MSVRELVERVVAVLARAESLFSSPSEGAQPRAARTLTDAADASAAIAARTDELSGAGAAAHRDALSAAAEKLEHAAETDTRLAEQLARAGQAHAAGASESTQLREGAQDVPDQLDDWTGLPAGELATLLAIRNRVADMQRLVADHTSQAAQATDDIVRLHYPQ